MGSTPAGTLPRKDDATDDQQRPHPATADAGLLFILVGLIVGWGDVDVHPILTSGHRFALRGCVDVALSLSAVH
jgi:hypothetical protein